MTRPTVPDEVTATLATPANMRRYEREHPPMLLPNGARISAPIIFAWSPLTGEECSATSGDYWDRGDDVPLRDSEGEPMVLAKRRTILLDPFTEEVIG